MELANTNLAIQQLTQIALEEGIITQEDLERMDEKKRDLVMGGMYTILQLRLYTPEMKEFAKNIIPISNDIKEYFIRFFYRCGCNRRYCNF